MPQLECRILVTALTDVAVELVEIRTGPAVAAPVTAEALPIVPALSGYRYRATHPALYSAVGARIGRAVWSTGQPGYLLYGPYEGIRAGRYRATVHGGVTRSGGLGTAWADVSADRGLRPVGMIPLSENGLPDVLGKLTFVVSEYTDQTEIRIYSDAASDFYVTGIVLEELGPELSLLPADQDHAFGHEDELPAAGDHVRAEAVLEHAANGGT